MHGSNISYTECMPKPLPDHRLSIEQNDPRAFPSHHGTPVTPWHMWQTAEFVIANPDKVADPAQAIRSLERPLRTFTLAPQDSHNFGRALALQASLGPLAARAARQTPDTALMQDAEEAFKPTADAVLTLSRVPTDKTGRKLAPVVIYHSLLRHGDPHLFPYFASPREASEEHQNARHNLYVLADGLKVPLQATLGNTKSGNMQAGVFQIKTGPLLDTVPELTSLTAANESNAQALARLLLDGKEAPPKTQNAVDTACFFVAEAVHSFIKRITDQKGQRLPLDQAIPCDLMLSSLRDFWSYTAHTRVKQLPTTYSLQHGHDKVRFDRFTATIEGKNRCIRLFSGPRRTWQVILPQDASVASLTYDDNVFLRKFLSHPLS